MPAPAATGLIPGKISYNVKEAVAALGIPRTKLYAHTRQGRLKFFRDGRTILFLHKHLVDFVDALQAGQTTVH